MKVNVNGQAGQNPTARTQSWTLRASPGAEVGQGALQGGINASLTLTEDLLFSLLFFILTKEDQILFVWGSY